MVLRVRAFSLLHTTGSIDEGVVAFTLRSLAASLRTRKRWCPLGPHGLNQEVNIKSQDLWLLAVLLIAWAIGD
jgi:hypothetical protein